MERRKFLGLGLGAAAISLAPVSVLAKDYRKELPKVWAIKNTEKALYDKVYDPYSTNPISAMPAFGKNGLLSDHQIKAVVAFLKTIK